MLSNASEAENGHLRRIINNLRTIAGFFVNKYSPSLEPFETIVTTGNPISIGGTRLRRIWSGFIKGAPNMQYAAQISFVLNPDMTYFP